MVAFSVTILSFYFFLIFFFLFGWKRLKKFENSDDASIKISVIIAFRNEADNLPRLISDLNQQTYPKALLEVIFINDHSDDASVNILTSSYMPHFKIIHSPKNQTGKKKAIKQGILKAVGDLFLFTDADCYLPNDWVETHARYFEQTKSRFTVAPVAIRTGNSWQNFQSLEFISLAMSTAGAVGVRMPIMCNGANMAIERKAYFRHQKNIKEEYASGDDMFMMLSLRRESRNAVNYLKSEKAIVETDAQPTLKSFLHQRRRWAGKTKGYTDVWVLSVAILVFGVSVSLILALLLGEWPLFFILLGMKSMPDYFILKQGRQFFKKNELKWYFVPLQLVYPFYVTISAFSSLFPTVWKQRKI